MTISISDYAIRMAVINPRGRLDARHAPALRAQLDTLLGEGTTLFVIDLSETRFMDSAGLAAIVNLRKRVRHAGGEVILARPNQKAVQRMLNLTRFDQIFQITDSVEAAIASFQIALPTINHHPFPDHSVEKPYYVIPFNRVYSD